MTANVLNFFEQPGPDGDNKFVCEGTVQLRPGKVTGPGGDILFLHSASLLFPNIGNTGDDAFFGPGIAGRIVEINAVLQGAGSAAATTLTFTINTIGITDSLITIPLSSSAGLRVQSVPTALNIISTGSVIKVVSSQPNATVVAVSLSFTIIPE